MTRIVIGLFGLVLSAATVGCSAGDGGASEPTSAASEDELRSVATSFHLTQPLDGARMEALRKALSSIDDQGHFVRNYHLGAGIRFETRSAAPLDDAARADLVQAAYTFWMKQSDPSAKSRRYASGLARTTDLAGALDGIGLEVDVEDPASDAARASLDATLASVAATKNVSVWKARLPKEDMSWYGLFVALDEDRHEILFETGGYGN